MFVDILKLMCNNLNMQYVDKAGIKRVNDIMLSIKNGDREAVAMLFELIYKPLYHIAFKYSRNSFTAEELVAEVFANIDYISSRYSKGHNAFNFLCKIIKNKYLNIIRYNNRHAEVRLEDNFVYTKSSLDDRVEDITIKDALKQLDMDEFRIINCKFYLNMTFREIAKNTGLSLGKVQRIYNKAIEKLKNFL